jgi:hypothetical protein
LLRCLHINFCRSIQVDTSQRCIFDTFTITHTHTMGQNKKKHTDETDSRRQLRVSCRSKGGSSRIIDVVDPTDRLVYGTGVASFDVRPREPRNTKQTPALPRKRIPSPPTNSGSRRNRKKRKDKLDATVAVVVVVSAVTVDVDSIVLSTFVRAPGRCCAETARVTSESSTSPLWDALQWRTIC